MHSFYIEPPVDGFAALPAEEAKHASKVLRLRPGDEICAMDGAGRRWRGEIAATDGGGVTARLLEELPSNEAQARVTVYEGLPKADKLDFIAQKLTELGAARLVPVRMARCVVKLDAKDGAKRRERLEKIAREATKQCGRGLPLEISAPLDWSAALSQMQSHDALLIPWEDARGTRVKDVCAALPEARDIGIVIGPEGGMSPQEVAAMRAVGGRTVTLGPRILRTETAAVVSAALAMQLWGDI
ncbi:MAG: 16S rRNA (uracil(1498)-N(3))-methyltransferase [Clostridia bacterium]|nr:16S rRNA (uracil(1498)-N(3))-methyltransferase [Clostridia bacterium]